MNRRFSKIIIFLSLFFPVFVFGVEPKAMDGVLDLHSANWNSDQIYRLDGSWRFDFDKLITPETELSSTDVQYIQVPEAWNQGGKYPAKGYATYRLKVLLPASVRYSIRLPEISTSSRLYINGKLLGEAGIVSDSEKTYRGLWRTQDLYPEEPAQELDIILQAANYDSFKGGVESSILVGPVRAMKSLRETGIIIDSFIFGVLLIMAIYHFGLFSLRRRDRSALYFGLFCLIIAARTLITGERLFTELLSNLPFHYLARMEYLTITLPPLIFTLFIQFMYPEEIWKKFIIGVSFITGLYSFIILIFPPALFTALLPLYHGLLIVFALGILIVLVRAAVHKREGALFIIAGCFILFAALFNDILNSYSIINTGMLFSFGVLAFIFLQSYLLSVRFSGAFLKIEMMSAKLDSFNKELIMKVEDRTQELELEKNILRQRNQTMEQELDLARSIQAKLIPYVSPMEELAFYYNPMEKVGGDFFDFIPFEDKNKVGIFISDVSGHGVSAAFITCMIKTILMRLHDEYDDPAKLISSLNDFIADQTGGNFITALYGIYDKTKKEFLYSNAGHPAPYLLTEDEVFVLDSARSSLPLGVLSRGDLERLHKPYTNELKVLSSKSKLFLYTDGLLETVNFKNKNGNLPVPDFETAVFMNAMSELKGLSSTEFILSMAERLKKFRGSATLDDDVCMICLDVV